MKRIVCFLLVITLSFLLCCEKVEDIPEGSIIYEFNEPNENPLVGLGAQIDTDTFTFNHFTEEEDKMVEDRIRDMNLQYTRIKFFPEYFERENDNDDPYSFDYNSPSVDFSSAEMKALYRILDICEKYNIKADLSWSGCFNTISYLTPQEEKVSGSWLASEGIGWVTGPKMIYEGDTLVFDGYSEYAENVYACLNYLINVKGYTCIWGISNISESFTNDKGVKDWREFVESCRVIHERLQREGLRDKVKFLGSSEVAHSLNANVYKEELETMDGIIDVCAVGNYHWDNSFNIESGENYFDDYLEVAHKEGYKDFVISEFCQGRHFYNAVDKSDIDDYDAGLYISRIMVAAIQSGVTAMNHYILCDTCFTNDSLDSIHTMGLWMHRDNGSHDNENNDGARGPWTPSSHTEYVPFAAHPEYYFWGLICKYTDSGSLVYRGKEILKNEYGDKDGDLSVIGFFTPEGKWSYILVNNSIEEKKVSIRNNNDNYPKKLNGYKVVEEEIPLNRDCVLPSKYIEIKSKNGITNVVLPPRSLVVLSNK